MIESTFYISETVIKISGFIQKDRLPLVGEYVVSNAKYLCPVGVYTDGRVGGRLRGSITWATENKHSKVEPLGKPPARSEDAVTKPNKILILRIGTNVEYAPHVELGTHAQTAQPYLRPAVELYKREIIKLMTL